MESREVHSRRTLSTKSPNTVLLDCKPSQVLRNGAKHFGIPGPVRGNAIKFFFFP